MGQLFQALKGSGRAVSAVLWCFLTAYTLLDSGFCDDGEKQKAVIHMLWSPTVSQVVWIVSLQTDTVD